MHVPNTSEATTIWRIGAIEICKILFSLEERLTLTLVCAFDSSVSSGWLLEH